MAGAVRLVRDLPEAEALRRYFSSLSGETARLNRAYLTSEINRGFIAQAEGISLGQLLRAFNETQPQSASIPFEVAGVPYHVRSMPALCDDLTGDVGYGCFGTPVTLRFHLAEGFGLPSEMFALADRHFIGYGVPFKVGWAFGAIIEDVLCLSCLQSEIGQRHSVLFGQPGRVTLVRQGDHVVKITNNDLVAAYRHHQKRLRSLFARRWRMVLVKGCIDMARGMGLDRIAIRHRAPEKLPRTVRPLYNSALLGLPGRPLTVTTDLAQYSHHMVATAVLNANAHLFLGGSDPVQ